MDLGRIFWIVGGEHAAGCPGGFGHGGGAFEDDDAEVVLGEVEGEGESDDSRAGDDYIGGFHTSILGQGCRTIGERDFAVGKCV